MQAPHSPAFEQMCSLASLLGAFERAARAKRRKAAAAAFEHQLADRLLELRAELLEGRYRPQRYARFEIREPKRRVISAAPFRDRVVHHALCSVIEPRFERLFIPDSYANRVGRGTHRALARMRELASRYRYVLRADIRQHFASIDHAILLDGLRTQIPEPDLLRLVADIVASGEEELRDEYRMGWFDGDDLLAACRPRGLPIGNLTSQFWSNCYLHPFDLFVKRELGCAGYLRYVDDFALFADSKAALQAWQPCIEQRLARLRLAVHAHSFQVAPTAHGTPWLGFVVYPDHVAVKARKVREATRRLGARYDAWRAGEISFGEFDASVQGWINHVRFADSWGLRTHMLSRFELAPGCRPHGAAAGRKREPGAAARRPQ